MGASWWFTGIIVLVMVLFSWFVYPKSDRFVVNPEEGMKAVQRDARQRQITAKAGRNGFVALNFLFLVVTVYAELSGVNAIPVSFVAIGVAVGFAVYLVSDLILRR